MSLYRSTLCAALLSAFALPVFAADAVPSYVKDAVADRGREPWQRDRDAARHPADVLAFANVKPGQVVVDMIPGDGYYTRILSALVGDKGKVYAIVPDGGGAGDRGSRTNQRDGKAPSAVPKDFYLACTLGCYPTGRPPYMLPIDGILAIQNITEYKNVTAMWEEFSSSGGDLSVPDQADVVFTADGYSQLHRGAALKLVEGVPGRTNGAKGLDVTAFTKSIYGDLKPGGYYVVADFAAAKGAGVSAANTLHRTEADAVKAEVTGAGFTFDGESPVLANASDTHAKAVDGIASERDGMVQYLLRFRKPPTAPATDKRPTAAQEHAIMDVYYGNTIFHGVSDPNGIVVKDGKVVSGVIVGISPKGERLRYSYFNPDHTYQEMGRVGEGPGPMQSGIWYWDADGHNCEIHQYPIDERQNIVCHVDETPGRHIGVVEKQNPDGTGRPTEIVKGHVYVPNSSSVTTTPQAN
jgi:predicted methyltransferase